MLGLKKAEETVTLTKQLLEAEQKMRIAAENTVAEMTRLAESAESKFIAGQAVVMAAQADVANLSIEVESKNSTIAELNKNK